MKDIFKFPSQIFNRFLLEYKISLASAVAIQFYNTWIFISSPSKSALNGLQTHSLN